MTISSAILSKPIDWRDPKLWPLLADLQGNILKGHGRDHTINHFFQFGADIAKVKEMIRSLSGHITSALRQLNEVEAFHNFNRPGGTAFFFFLSASGYQKLGLPPPSDPAFQASMRNRSALNDPAASDWDAQHRDAPHALLIVADDSDSNVANAAEFLVERMRAAGMRLLGRDAGRALRIGAKGPGLEHFGYLDGRSQPLMLVDEVNREKLNDGIDKWDPAFGPGTTALVSDPHGTGPDSYGSYLVYRKLEQNVQGFKEREEALAGALGLVSPADERAGAMVVGRFENGTPVAVSESDQPANVTNNFTYGSLDPDGLKCPFQGHIRKTNPRGEVGGDGERIRLMPRRGIPFGERQDQIDDDDNSQKPTHGVGLVFMAYNQDIQRQFEFTQISWVNNPDFSRPKTGIDPIIGEINPTLDDSQRPDAPKWRAKYNDASDPEVPFEFDSFVTMRGGEYFFAPSIGFLRTIS